MNNEELNYTAQPVSVEKNNYIKGLLGAIVGALIGSILWVVVYQLGIIAAICGMAIALCSIKGYILLGGKVNLIGIIMVIVVILASVFLAEFTGLAISVSRELGISISDALDFMSIALKDSEVKMEVIKELIIGYVFTIAGVGSYLSKSKRGK